MEPQLLLVSFSLLALAYYFLFHQNRHFPPSPLWRLPIVGHMHLLGPILHQSLHHLSLRYGPLFSLQFGSRLFVVVSSPHLAKHLLQNNEPSFNSHKDTAVVKRLTYNASMAFAPLGDYWRFIKKLTMNELLGPRSISKFQHLRVQETGNLLRTLARKAEAREAVDVTAELLKLTNNLISRMLLGESEEARDVVRDASKIIGEFNISDVIWLFKKVDFQGFGKRVEDVSQRFDALIERIICKREEMRKKNKLSDDDKGDQFKDFLDILLDCAEDESSEVKIERINIKGLIVDFFTAGTDTTAIAIEWALAELMNHPLLLQKAQEEIHNVVGKNRVVEESDCANLPYLQAIIKETFRLHPPLPLITRRCVADCKIENYVIPKDSLLFVNAWSITRDPKNWKNPLEFLPERFLEHGEGDSIDVRGQHFQLLPFGTGRRACPAISLSKQHLPAVLGAIIQCFDFHLVDPKGRVLKGHDVVVNVDERPGLTAPKVQNLVCVPVQRMIQEPIQMFGC